MTDYTAGKPAGYYTKRYDFARIFFAPLLKILDKVVQYIPLMFTRRIQYIIYECLSTHSGPDWNQLSTGQGNTAWVYGEEAEPCSVNSFYPTLSTVLSKQFYPTH